MRVASNEAMFAAANDAIALRAASIEPVPLVPFLCECAEPACTEIAEMTLGEYATLRLFAQRFVISPRCSGGEVAGAELLERTLRYSVVERPAPALN